jgi:hypothetical protein
MTEGTDTPVEYLVEFEKLVSNHLSKSVEFVGYAPYWLVEPLPPFTLQI